MQKKAARSAHVPRKKNSSKKACASAANAKASYSHVWSGERKQPFFGLHDGQLREGRYSPDARWTCAFTARPSSAKSHLPAGSRGREAEVEELYNAVVHRRPVFHDGRWGAATLGSLLGDARVGRKAQRNFPFASGTESGMRQWLAFYVPRVSEFDPVCIAMNMFVGRLFAMFRNLLGY